MEFNDIHYPCSHMTTHYKTAKLIYNNMVNKLLLSSHLLLFVTVLAVKQCSCQTPTPVHFDCPKLPPLPPAQTVYELKPQDIKVVMALGDSVTAGEARDCVSVLLVYNIFM